MDINVTIDVLRHAFNDSTDCVYLVTGDGDYIPLVEEVMRRGKQVFGAAFSDGLNPRLPDVCDSFKLLDRYFFQVRPPGS